jgi:hypothetical protein
MTDEERQKLCESLRLAFSPWPCRIAADEIERLAERLKAAHGYEENALKKFMTLPIVAGIAAQPVAAPSGALFVTAGAAITTGGLLMLGGCARPPGMP